MKGVSAVIATILLLLIAVAIVGLSFGFFQRIFRTATTAAESQIDTTTAQLQQSVGIQNANSTAVVVSNTGSGTISTSILTVYINNALTGCSWSASSIAPGAIAVCTYQGTCTAGATVKVSAPAMSATEKC